jgi:hypothetical protein
MPILGSRTFTCAPGRKAGIHNRLTDFTLNNRIVGVICSTPATWHSMRRQCAIKVIFIERRIGNHNLVSRMNSSTLNDARIQPRTVDKRIEDGLLEKLLKVAAWNVETTAKQNDFTDLELTANEMIERKILAMASADG